MPAKSTEKYQQPRRIGLALTGDLARSMRILGLEPEPLPGPTGIPGEPAGATEVTAALSRYAVAVGDAGRELERTLDRDEWNMIADLLNGCADLWDYSATPMPSLLLIRAQVEDGHRLDRSGDKWFGEEEGDRKVKALLGKLAKMSTIHGDAILAAARYFWRHAGIDHNEDRWWAVTHRTEVKAGQ